MKIKKLIIIIVMSFNMVSCQKTYMPGFDYSNFDNTPVEALARAVQKDDIEEITRLVKEEKIDVNYQEKQHGNMVLNLACINQKTETVEALLKLGANPNLFGGDTNTTAFLDAVYYKTLVRDCSTDKIKVLLKYGADVNSIKYDTIKSKKGVSNNQINTALMLACSNGCIDVVKVLVENGADINKYPRKENYGAISVALLFDKISIARYLIIDKQAKIPECVFIRQADINYKGEPETRFTITDMLLKEDYSNNPENQKAKEEILAYLKRIGKK